MGYKRNFSPTKGRNVKAKARSLNTFIQISYISQGFHRKKVRFNFIYANRGFLETKPTLINYNTWQNHAALHPLYTETMWTRISKKNCRDDITLTELEHIHNRDWKQRKESVVPYNRIRNTKRDISLNSFVDLDLNELVNRMTANGALVRLKPQCFCTLTAHALQNAKFYCQKTCHWSHRKRGTLITFFLVFILVKTLDVSHTRTPPRKQRKELRKWW